MNLKQLIYFLTIIEHESFTKAAAELRVAQPAITKSIQNLEHEIGLRLFIREKRSVRLTMEGSVLKKHALEIRQKINQTKKELKEIKEGIRGTVQIGIPSMAGSYYFPDKLSLFKEKHPDMEIDIYEAGTTAIEKEILEGNLEMGTVVVDEVSEMLDIHPFLQEPLMLVVPPSHPLASSSSVSLEKLVHEPLILFKEGYYQRKVIDRAGELAGKSPHIAFETNQISMAKSLTERSFGVTVFLNMVIRSDENLVAIPFDPPIILTLGIAHKKNLPLSTANDIFLSFLKKEVRDQ
ncbi:LysR family transcriptional regulator [Alteribacillus bidgolensis]|uniref:DNA-binding transcriptional regulator, LysR family n=1 Tax=Alteribacillus bidgolensis TaxID=930129 RepID=A0A1G8G0A9_9BACI|nr:LysR family transcriptional regulator [Alteribacillus bidgolensis]SDH87814.1 DNA-binding transcriptional regulator, LysR family [Alteribacillus bidgolensis]